jgi:mannose-1-phosphate guanylyltransferase / phosphomannomutase
MRQAVIVCGGKGLRLSRICGELPKGLVSLMGKSLLGYQIDELRRHRVEEVVLCVGHGADAIRSFFGDGSAWGLRILYSQEQTPLGTAGAVRAIQYPLDPHFFIIYGDILFSLDLAKLAQHHYRYAGVATLVLHRSDHPYDSDQVLLDRDSLITAFLGKPRPGQAFANLSNAAIYVLSRRVLHSIPTNRPTDFAHDIFPSLLKDGERLAGFVTDEYCKDIGEEERYRRAIADLRAGKVYFESSAPGPRWSD